MSKHRPIQREKLVTLGDLQSLPATLTCDELAPVLRMSRGSVFLAVRRGDIPSIRLGHRVLIPTARILAMLGLNEGEVADAALPTDTPRNIADLPEDS